LLENIILIRGWKRNKMEQEYKPTRKEVFNELGNEVKTSSKTALNHLKSGSKKSWNCIKRNASDFIDLQKIIYAIPSVMNDESKISKRSFGDNLGIVLDSMQLVFYLSNAANMASPESFNFGFEHNYWLIPVATNVASGFYEIGKKIYKNTEKKLIEKHNKGLEGDVTD